MARPNKKTRWWSNFVSFFFLNFNNNIGAIVFHNEVSFDE